MAKDLVKIDRYGCVLVICSIDKELKKRVKEVRVIQKIQRVAKKASLQVNEQVYYPIRQCLK